MNTVLNYIKGSYSEFKKIQWPTKEQTIRLTQYVIGVSLIIAVYVAGIDFMFTELLAVVLN